MKRASMLLAALLLIGCQAATNLPATFIVFFPSGSTELNANAQAAIIRAAEAARATGATQVAVASGVAEGDNLKLAEPRYQAVQRALIARGVSQSSIARSSLPSIGANTGPTADTRVEIILSR